MYATDIDAILLTTLCLTCIWFAWRWQTGLFGIILWEGMRDPVRKLLPEYLVSISIAGSLLWIACLIGCLCSSVKQDDRILPRQFRFPVILLIMFLILGTWSGWSHSVPVNVMGLGFVSYMFPFIGLIVGFHSGQWVSSIRQLIMLFCLLNALLIGTAFLEIAGFKSPVLGGIMMEWYRFRGTHNIPLPCGTYRSPDILGLHAAHVFAFAMLLALTATNTFRRIFWFLVMDWGLVILMMSARRKMQGLALVFFCIFVGFMLMNSRQWIRAKMHEFPRRVVAAVSLCFCGVIVFCVLAPNQAAYAASILTEGPQRCTSTILSSPIVTMRQSGSWGIGLGSATQGNTVIGKGFISGWQEDGLSRIVLEGGIVGAVCLCLSTILLMGWCLKQILHDVAKSPHGLTETKTIQIGLLSLGLGNLACYCISHQHVSGDPMFGALSGFWIGNILTGMKTSIRDAD